MPGIHGMQQQLPTATITITPNTTNQNLRDSVFITTAGLTPRCAIIKPKFSGWCGHCALTVTQSRAPNGPAAPQASAGQAGWLLQELRCATLLLNEHGLARICLSEAISRLRCAGAGRLRPRVSDEANSVGRVLSDGLGRGGVAGLQIVIVMAVMFYWNAKLAMLALVALPLLIAGALGYALTAHRRYRLQRRAASNINALLHDNLAGIRQIKSFAREREEHARFNCASDELQHATLVGMRTWASY